MTALTQNRVRELLDYDPETGVFRWRSNRGGSARAGSIAGSIRPKFGYVDVCVGREKWLGHRLAWLYVYGEIPGTIDHINGVTSDNRIANLRCCTQAENTYNTRLRKNNTSGFKGVSFCSMTKRWAAQIRKGKRKWTIGRFDTPEAAHEAYRKKAVELFGEFARMGDVG